MPSNMFLRKNIFIIISSLVFLLISVTAFATEQATEPVDMSTEAVTTAEANPTNENENDDDNDNEGEEKSKDRKNDLNVALIGFAGGTVPAIISVIYQSISTKKTLKNSNEQFKEQMAHSEKALSIQVEQIRNEQERYANAKKEEAIKMLMTEEDLVRRNLEKRYEFYTRTLYSELKRIEAISNPDLFREREKLGMYNRINSCLSSMEFGCELHGKVSYNIGQLVNYIDGYNHSIENIKSIEINCLEVFLNKIFLTARKIESDIVFLCAEDKNTLIEYYRKSAESMFEIARQLEPQTNNDSEENNKPE